MSGHSLPIAYQITKRLTAYIAEIGGKCIIPTAAMLELSDVYVISMVRKIWPVNGPS